MHRHSLRGVAVVAACASLLAGGVSSASAAANRTTLRGSAPAWASARHLSGPADSAGTVQFRVYLGWRDADAAAALAQAVSDPRSASYGTFLTPSQFRRRFAPSASQVQTVRKWLTQQGFDVAYIPSNNHYVAAEGTVAQAEAAFGATMKTYAINGERVRSPSGDVSIPSSLAGAVTGVIGLDDSAVFV
ncbi:MAG TPA: protease pro-enzyme activation domain-containing protein, partial [Solirubrobacter sp.]|nr:protease pro-enzyme activation domain-containing protein [Solirubrobacter sp.]